MTDKAIIQLLKDIKTVLWMIYWLMIAGGIVLAIRQSSL